jgi:hypothetical protein
MRLAWLVGVVVVTVACGNVTSSARDGGTPDAGPAIDGDLPDVPGSDAALPGRVEVTVKRGGLVAEDVAVLFSNPDGTPVARLLTDENGYTRADLDPKGILSVLWTETDGTKRAAVFYGLYAGDHIQFEIPAEPGATTSPGDLDYDFGPSAGQPASADRFVVHNGCSETEMNPPLANFVEAVDSAACVTPTSKMNVWVRGYDGTQLVAHGIAVDIPQAAGDWDANVAWQAAGTPITVTLSNAPAHNTTLLVDGYLERETVRYSLDGTTQVGGTGTGLTHAVHVPSGFADHVTLQVGVFWDLSSGPEGYSMLSVRAAAAANPFVVDLGARLLARVNDLTLDQTNIARPTTSWASDAPLDADAILVEIRQKEDGANEQHAYRLYLPPDHPPSVKLPVYEGDVASWAPEIRPFEDPRLFVFDMAGADGYRAVNFGNALGTGDEYRIQFVGDK